jgi:hypothetical protein
LVVDSVAASEVEVSEAEASGVVVIGSVAVEESVTKVAAVVSEDKHRQTPPLVLAADVVVDLGEGVTVGEAGLTVV